jgi:uncharacterized protein YjbI with pentapeptide repeats
MSTTRIVDRPAASVARANFTNVNTLKPSALSLSTLNQFPAPTQTLAFVPPGESARQGSTSKPVLQRALQKVVETAAQSPERAKDMMRALLGSATPSEVAGGLASLGSNALKVGVPLLGAIAGEMLLPRPAGGQAEIAWEAQNRKQQAIKLKAKKALDLAAPRLKQTTPAKNQTKLPPGVTAPRPLSPTEAAAFETRTAPQTPSTRSSKRIPVKPLSPIPTVTAQTSPATQTAPPAATRPPAKVKVKKLAPIPTVVNKNPGLPSETAPPQLTPGKPTKKSTGGTAPIPKGKPPQRPSTAPKLALPPEVRKAVDQYLEKMGNRFAQQAVELYATKRASGMPPSQARSETLGGNPSSPTQRKLADAIDAFEKQNKAVFVGATGGMPSPRAELAKHGSMAWFEGRIKRVTEANGDTHVELNLRYQDLTKVPDLEGTFRKLRAKYGAEKFVIDLTNANLSGAKLIGVNLRAANLTGTQFDGANLNYAKFDEHSVLNGTNFHGASLFEANFSNAQLNNVTMTHAEARLANFSGSSWQNVNANFAQLSQANMQNATIQNSQLRATNLQWSNLDHTQISESDLTGANISHTTVNHARFTECTLSSATIQRSSLQDTSFYDVTALGARLEYTEFVRARLQDSNFTGSNLTGTQWRSTVASGNTSANIVDAINSSTQPIPNIDHRLGTANNQFA